MQSSRSIGWLVYIAPSRHCELSEAIHRTAYADAWIASSLSLLAMTDLYRLTSCQGDG